MRVGCILVMIAAVALILITRAQMRETLENPPKKEPDILVRVGKLETDVAGITSELTSLSAQFKEQQSEINQAQAQVSAASAQISGSTS